MLRRNSRLWTIPGFNKTRYEGDGAGSGEGGGSGTPPPTPPPAPAKTFTQEQVNNFLAEERRKMQTKNQQTITELENLRNSARLTEEEKSNLTARIEALQSETQSKEQQLTREVETYRKKIAETEQSLTKRVEEWQGRYTELLVDNTIASAAAKNDVYKETQVLGMLKPRAKVVPIVDDAGKTTDKFQVVIKFDDVDAKTGNPITLELSPDAALKRMKELPEEYGNLFKSGVTPGVGKSKGTGPTGEPDVKAMDAKAFREYRKTRGY